jgi:hypothetical protein
MHLMLEDPFHQNRIDVMTSIFKQYESVIIESLITSCGLIFS